MKFKLVHKAGASDNEHSTNNANNTTMKKGKTRATEAPHSDETYHNPDDPSYDPRLDPDVGPYDADNDYLPDETMTDEEVAKEVAKIEKEEAAAKKDLNKTFHGPVAPKAPAVQQRPTKTCDNCKKLKKGCDLLLPACTKCQARGIPCVYSRG